MFTCCYFLVMEGIQYSRICACDFWYLSHQGSYKDFIRPPKRLKRNQNYYISRYLYISGLFFERVYTWNLLSQCKYQLENILIYINYGYENIQIYFCHIILNRKLIHLPFLWLPPSSKKIKNLNFYHAFLTNYGKILDIPKSTWTLLIHITVVEYCSSTLFSILYHISFFPHINILTFTHIVSNTLAHH